MTDKREDILERLVDISAATAGVTYAVRNVLDLTESRMPAVVVLEGNEEPSEAVEPRRRNPQAPIVMTMVPELCIVDTRPSDELGTNLNTIRAALIKAVYEDSQLRTILGTNGWLTYRGLESDLGIGRAMLGRMSLRFAITYVIYPDQL